VWGVSPRKKNVAVLETRDPASSGVTSQSQSPLISEFTFFHWVRANATLEKVNGQSG
jgi:hypothetical protein